MCAENEVSQSESSFSFLEKCGDNICVKHASCKDVPGAKGAETKKCRCDIGYKGDGTKGCKRKNDVGIIFFPKTLLQKIYEN